jgi:hypothetical protein
MEVVGKFLDPTKCIYIYIDESENSKGDRNMNNLIPDFLTPYVLIGTVAVVAAVLFGLRSTLKAAGLPVRERQRAFWGGSGLLAAWLVAALLPSWLGFYHGRPSGVPTIQYGLLIPIVAGVALFWQWPALRRIIELVPQQWMVSIQFYRVLGVIFLVLYAGGRLPGEFAWPAGAGDAMVGLLAPLAGIAYARGWRGSAGWLRAWNLLGIGDLVVAVATGFLSSPSPLQMLAFDRPNDLITSFPLVLIPVFLVPLSVLLHLASLEKLRQTETGPRVLNPLLAGRQG